MATLLGDFFGKRRPGFTGRLIIDNYRGVTRVRTWPKKYGKARSALQQQWIDWFRGANFGAKYASSLDINRSKEITEGTYYYPRDIILKAMRGRLYWWDIEGEGKWFPVAAVTDVSDSLDVLAQFVGNILVRDVEGWRSPADGAEGDVLTFHPSAPPDWQPTAGGGDGAFVGALATRTGIQTITRLTMTTMLWQTEEHDTDALLDLGVSASRFTIPAGFSWCRLSAGIGWATGNVGFRLLQFIKNGAAPPGGGMVRPPTTGQDDTIALTSAVLPCVEGDYFEAQVYHNHNSSLAVRSPGGETFFAIQAFP